MPELTPLPTPASGQLPATGIAAERLAPASKERREELAKVVRKIAEDGRVSIRTARHHSIELIKKEKDKVSEDEVFTAQDEVQKLTDKHISKIDETLKQKEKEVLEL